MTFSRHKHERSVFLALLQTVPGLEERLTEGTEDAVAAIAGLVSHGHLVFAALCSIFFQATKGHIQRQVR
jgi:hypothetical protein